MSISIIFTFIGTDKPGLIKQLSETVSDNDGNWLESRMSQLAGKFAGIARVQVPEASAEPLVKALKNLSGAGLEVAIQTDASATPATDTITKHLSLVGNDRIGIVHELSKALSMRGINVGEMNTNVTSAPMTGEALFEASAEIQVPRSLDLEELSDALEEVANELAVDIHFDD